MKGKKNVNVDKNNSDQQSTNQEDTSCDISQGPKLDRKGKRKANILEKESPLSKVSKHQNNELDPSAEKSPMIVKLQRPVIPVNNRLVYYNSNVIHTTSKFTKAQTVRSVSPLKSILPATSGTNDCLDTSKISSPTPAKTKKVVLSSTTPRKVLPKLPMVSNVSDVAASAPLLVRSGGKLLRLVPSQESQSPLVNTSKPLVLQKLRKPDGTIVQVLKQANLTSTQSIQPKAVAPTIFDENSAASSCNAAQKIILGKPTTLPKKSYQIQQSPIIKTASLPSSQMNLAQNASTIVLNPAQQKAIKCLTSCINPPKLIKLNTNNVKAPTAQPRLVIQPNPSTTRTVVSPKQPIKIQKLSSQMSQVEANQRHLVKAVSGITQAVEKITRACIQEHAMSLKSGIPTTLPDDFLDSGDSDSEKSHPQSNRTTNSSEGASKEGSKITQKGMDIYLKSVATSLTSTPSTTAKGRPRKAKTDKKENELLYSDTNKNTNEIVTSADPSITSNERTSEANSESVKSDTKLKAGQKRVSNEDIQNEAPAKKTSRSDSKLQKAVIETNTKSSRLGSGPKAKILPKILPNLTSKSYSKSGSRSKTRRK